MHHYSYAMIVGFLSNVGSFVNTLSFISSVLTILVIDIKEVTIWRRVSFLVSLDKIIVICFSYRIIQCMYTTWVDFFALFPSNTIE
jgi:hypothetical protein